MKGYNNDYGGGGGSTDLSKPVNGKDYNSPGSSTVREVDSVEIKVDAHNIPQIATPNSVVRNFRDGTLSSERYYDSNGQAYLDIDYTDHGNPKTHPKVPHEHDIWIDSDGNFRRGKDNDIR